MSVLDTFYILFKTNADDVKKGMKEVDKAAKETEKSLKNSNEQAETLGKSFLKIVEGAGAMAGAYTAFNFIKNGVIDQAKYNAELQRTAELHQMSAQNLKTVIQLAHSRGGDVGGALGMMKAQMDALQVVGGMGDPIQQLRKWRQMVQAAGAPYSDPKQRQNAENQAMQSIGITDVGFQKALSIDTNAEFEANLNRQADLVKAPAGTFKNAEAAVENLAESDAALGNVASTIGNDVIPAFDALVKKFNDFTDNAGKSSAGSWGLAAAETAGSVIVGGVSLLGIGKWALRALGTAAKAAPIATEAAEAAPIAAEAAGGASIVAEAGTAAATLFGLPEALVIGAGAVGYGPYMRGLQRVHDWAANRHKMAQAAPASNSLASSVSGSSGNPDMDYWVKQGYTPAAAAAIVENINAESNGGDPRANGYARGENSYGLAQWHPDRAKKIKDALGIDIYSGSKEDQLKAMAWEMQGHRKGFDNSKFKSMTDPAAAAKYFSDYFETPADRAGQGLKRGKAALGLASNYQGTPGAKTVNIGSVTINTQATDAKGIAKDFHSMLSQLAANSSDGVGM